MLKKTQIPDYLVEKYGTDSAEEIKAAKQNAERLDTAVFEKVSVEKVLGASEFKTRLSELGIEYRKELEDRQAVFTISTEDVDRDGDIIKADGIDTSDYLKNPVVLFAHDSTSLPIGVSLKLYRSNKQTKAVVLFFDDTIDKTGTSDTIFRFVKAGGIKGASIGFRPIKARFPDQKELDTLGMGPYGVMYEKTSLLEWSVVSVPANQNALRSKALKDCNIKHLKELGLVADDIDEMEFADPTEIEEGETVEISIGELLDEIGDEKKFNDEAIILLKGIKSSIDTLSINLAGYIEKAGPVPSGSDKPEEKFDDLLKSLTDVINRIKQ